MERKVLARRKLRRPQTSRLTLQVRTDESRMFSPMQITRMFQLSKQETVEEAVAKLFEFAENPYRFPTNMK